MTEKSEVWKYFTADSAGGVICDLCKKPISQGSGPTKRKNTSNLWSHLRGHHGEEYKGIECKKIKPKKRPAEPTIRRDIFDSMRIWANSDKRAKKMDQLIVEMLATDNLPFSTTEKPGFIRVMAAAEPRYNMKSEKYYRTQGLQDVYSRVEKKIRELLSSTKSSKLSFTTDCWSNSTEALISLTAHFIDEKWERKQVILNVRAMEGSHTGQYIANCFISMLQYWEIESERVFLVLRDSGANMVKGMGLADVNNLSCFAHSLQLVVNDVLKAPGVLKELLAKFRSIATHFRHSVLAKQRLSGIQKLLGMDEHSILQSVPTRWNSDLQMLERMLEQRRALALYASEHGRIVCPTNDEWGIAEQLVGLLKPFDQITKDISHASASLSVVIPSVNVLKMLLQSPEVNTLYSGISSVRAALLSRLTARFSHITDCKFIVLACFLDPRYKDRLFDSLAKNRCRDWIAEEGKEVLQASPQIDTPVPPEEAMGLLQKATAFDHIFNTLLSNNDTAHSNEMSEVDQYLLEPLKERRETDPLQWWDQNKERLPILATLAKKYLAVPPTTVPSERLFSTIGLIYEDHRSSLLGENAEKLCFMNYNLRLLDWDY